VGSSGDPSIAHCARGDRTGVAIVGARQDTGAMSVRQQEGLGLGREEQATQRFMLAGDVVLQRIAFAAILAAEVEDQSDEEEPEDH
jgi:hypothetical protein